MVFLRSKRLRAIERRTQVKCHNYEKRGHFTRNYPKPAKVPLPIKTSELYGCSYEFISNSIPQWIIDTRTTEYIV